MFWSISAIIKNERPKIKPAQLCKEYLPSTSYTILLMEIFVCLFIRGQSNIAGDNWKHFPYYHNEYEKPKYLIETKSTK